MEGYTILSTKKLTPELLEEGAKNGLRILEEEAIAVKPIVTKEKLEEVMPVVLKREQTSVVFTSANAVQAVKNYLHQGANWFIPNWNVYCLAGKTKEALAPHLKEQQIIATATNATELAQKIIEAKNAEEVIFFCGNKRRDELPSILQNAGITVKEIVVYETVETPAVSAEPIDAILFFSPSAVQSFFSVNQLKENVVCFAIGDTTATAVADFTGNKIIKSEAPSAEMLLAAVAFYFSNKEGYKKAE